MGKNKMSQEVRYRRYFDVDSVEKLADALKVFLKKSGVGWMLSHREVVEAWNKAVGDEIGELTRVCSYRNGTLYVDVKSASLKAELEQFYAATLVKTICQANPEIKLRAIKFNLADFGEERSKENPETSRENLREPAQENP